jgi:rubrerythrin
VQDVPQKEREQSLTTMDDIQEKLRTLLDYWIEHNSEHEQEFRDWADKVASSSTEVAKQLQKAATKMAAVSDELMKAKQALPKSKGRH